MFYIFENIKSNQQGLGRRTAINLNSNKKPNDITMFLRNIVTTLMERRYNLSSFAIFLLYTLKLKMEITVNNLWTLVVGFFFNCYELAILKLPPVYCMFKKKLNEGVMWTGFLRYYRNLQIWLGERINWTMWIWIGIGSNSMKSRF